MFKARRLMPLALVRRAVVSLVVGVGAASVVAAIAAGVLAGADVLAATAALGHPSPLRHQRGGPAPGVTMHNGIYWYTIKG